MCCGCDCARSFSAGGGPAASGSYYSDETCKGGGSLKVNVPADPVEGSLGLTGGPFLVKVDRYGSVSGLVRVRVPLGILYIKTEGSEVPYGS